jgi:hypothetical protein
MSFSPAAVVAQAEKLVPLRLRRVGMRRLIEIGGTVEIARAKA